MNSPIKRYFSPLPLLPIVFDVVQPQQRFLHCVIRMTRIIDVFFLVSYLLSLLDENEKHDVFPVKADSRVKRELGALTEQRVKLSGGQRVEVRAGKGGLEHGS